MKKKNKYENSGAIPLPLAILGLPKKNLGGLLQSGLSMGANALLPGLGGIVDGVFGFANKSNAMLQQAQDNLSSVETQTNPYQAHGGYLALGGNIKEGSMEDALQFEGASHEQGGIDVNSVGIPSFNPSAEIEAGEGVFSIKDHLGKKKKYVFSKRLTV